MEPTGRAVILMTIDPNGIFKSFLIDGGVGSSRFIINAKLTSGTNVN